LGKNCVIIAEFKFWIFWIHFCLLGDLKFFY